MIQIKNLKKSFGDKMLFSNFNLSVDKGEFVVFSGISGCGKTTLLNIIGGIEPFDEGTVVVNGLNIRERKNQNKYFSETVRFREFEYYKT